MNLPDHIRISVDAVGGLNSEDGQEMLKLLAEREGLDLAELEQSAIPAPTPAIEAPTTDERETEPKVLGPELEAMFQRVFKDDPPVSPADTPGD